MIYGIEEDGEGYPVNALGIELSNIDAEIQKFNNMRKAKAAEDAMIDEEEEDGDVDEQGAGDLSVSVEEPAADESTEISHEQGVDIPMEVGGKLKTNGCKSFSITLKGVVKNEKDRGRFTEQHIKLHLQAHTRAQARKLRHQLETEALAVQALRGQNHKLFR